MTVALQPLQQRVLRLASAGWASPQRLREALAGLLDAGSSADAEAVVERLEAAAGPTRPLPDRAVVDGVARRLDALRAQVWVVGEPRYPTRLADAWPELGAPLWLFARGGAALPPGPAVAVVGTRRPTADGLRTARELGRLLAAHGVLVVSGLARGIDQAAHRGALEAGGQTLAVLGTGLDVVYPAGSRALQDAIAEHGALVTEYPPGTGPRPHHFLARNRIISGLADATVVVEGRARSGALQTARLAAAQGRDVLAVPGSLHAPASQAPLELIRDGAQPLTAMTEVLTVVGLTPQADNDAVPAVEPRLALILDLLGGAPVSAGELAAAAGLGVGEVLAAVGELAELGLATQTARGFLRAGPQQSH